MGARIRLLKRLGMEPQGITGDRRHESWCWVKSPACQEWEWGLCTEPIERKNASDTLASCEDNWTLGSFNLNMNSFGCCGWYGSPRMEGLGAVASKEVCEEYVRRLMPSASGVSHVATNSSNAGFCFALFKPRPGQCQCDFNS